MIKTKFYTTYPEINEITVGDLFKTRGGKIVKFIGLSSSTDTDEPKSYPFLFEYYNEKLSSHVIMPFTQKLSRFDNHYGSVILIDEYDIMKRYIPLKNKLNLL